MGTNGRRLKAQHNLIFGDARCLQFLRDAILDAVALNPDFVVNNLDVGDAPMHPSFLLPAHIEQQEMIARLVNNQMLIDVAIGIGNFSILAQNRFNGLPIEL